MTDFYNSDPRESCTIPQELYGAASIIVGKENSSGPRLQMWGSHISQVPANDGVTRRRFTAGVEQDFAKYTFVKQFEHNARILKVIQKYPKKEGFEAIKSNPETYIIYEDIDNPNRVYLIVIPRYKSNHQIFGFRYKATPVMEEIYEGAEFPKGTVIANTPSVDEEVGTWNYGFEANLAMMGVPAVIEDGYVANEATLERLTMTGVEARSFSFGKKMYPINLYGNDNNFKAIPDIGEPVRADGILVAFREYDDELDAINMSPYALRTVRASDFKIRAKPGAIVHDIDIVINPQDANYATPLICRNQFDKYFNEHRKFFNEITEVYSKLKDPRNVDPALHALVREGLYYSGFKGKDSSVIEYRNRRNKLDHYQVKITYSYKIKPGVGFKITGGVGDKGVIVAVWPEHMMPIDDHGHRADFITDAQSTVKRMNPTRFYNQYINATTRDYCEIWRQWIGLPKDKPQDKNIAAIYEDDVERAVYDKKNAAIVNKIAEQYLEIYDIISPEDAKICRTLINKSNAVKLSNVTYILRHLPVFTRFTDMEGKTPPLLKVVRELRVKFPIQITPVTFKVRTQKTKENNLPPETVRSVEPIFIGSEYLIFLEKIGTSWSAVASSKLQHFGVPAKLTNQDKFSSLVRNNPTKIFGESEVRLINSVDGGFIAADMIDQSNNPLVHKNIVNNVLMSDNPTNIDKIVDRVEYPMGNGRILNCAKHLIGCAGFEFTEGGEEINDVQK